MTPKEKLSKEEIEKAKLNIKPPMQLIEQRKIAVTVHLTPLTKYRFEVLSSAEGKSLNKKLGAILEEFIKDYEEAIKVPEPKGGAL